MSLTEEQKRTLSAALLDAYRKQIDLQMMLSYRLGRKLLELVTPGPLKTVVFELVEEAESDGWEAALIDAAFSERRGNPQLGEFHKTYFKILDPVAETAALEKIIRQASPFVDIQPWRTRLAEVERRVCRVEIDGKAIGTGFLVGPAVVLTNHHVLSAVIAGKVAPGRVGLRFDFKRAAQAVTAATGCVHHLAQDWLVDASPPSGVDSEPDPKSGQPKEDELDFALVRLEECAGNEPVEGARRGWIHVTGDNSAVGIGTPLIIVQHPLGQPLQLAIDTEGVRSINGNSTRVRYTTNTQPGSSGSPCFRMDWTLVALHHSGDPAFVATYNEGIPISMIRDRLSIKGLLSQIGGLPPPNIMESPAWARVECDSGDGSEQHQCRPAAGQ